MLHSLKNDDEVAPPVAVFAFNRPAHLRRTLLSLIACDGFDERSVYIFIDGPRNELDEKKVQQVHEIVLEMLGLSAKVVAQEKNIGLAKSITLGVGKVLSENNSVVVIEDDLELSPIFLRFMDEALAKYRDQLDIFQISGHMFNVPEFHDRTSSIILPFTTTWGWGTWRRAWEAYDPTGHGWKEMFSDREMRRRFDLGGCYPYSEMLARQQKGLSDSWGIRWYWSVFKRDGLCLFPPQSLVRNTGQDGSGTHGGGGILTDFSGKNGTLLQAVPTMPKEVAVFEADFAATKDAIWKQNGGWLGWAMTKIKGWLGR